MPSDNDEACLTPADERLINYRLHVIENAIKAMADGINKLANLEQRHTETRESLERAFKTLEKHDTRIRAVEQEMPTMKLTRGWIVAGVVGVFAMVGVGIMKLVIAH